jgi:aryl-alcohol dehydrogenase-like predicted oxidoreductase
MKYRWLGSSGLLVSRISLGTMTFGTDNWGCGEKESHAIPRAYVGGGGNFIGCSNIFGWQIAKAAGISARLNLERLVAGQYIYSLIHRELEREIIPAAIDSGLGITAYSPLGGGLLTGKYKGMKEPQKGTRHAFRTQVDGPRFWHEQGFRTAALLEQVAQESGIPMAKLAVAWPLRRKFVSSVTIGVRTVDQLSLSLEIGDWDMPQDVWNTLEERTRPPEEYTGWFAKANYKRFFGAAEFHDERAELP